MKYLCFVLLLCGCAAQPETVFAPVDVDMPVPVACAVPDIAPPPDVMKDLPPTVNLTAFTKACVQQILQDRAALLQFQAAVKGCDAR